VLTPGLRFPSLSSLHGAERVTSNSASWLVNLPRTTSSNLLFTKPPPLHRKSRSSILLARITYVTINNLSTQADCTPRCRADQITLLKSILSWTQRPPYGRRTTSARLCRTSSRHFRASQGRLYMSTTRPSTDRYVFRDRATNLNAVLMGHLQEHSTHE
jgi:hypothetical protein